MEMIIFNDSAQRTVIGELYTGPEIVSKDDIVVKNPVVVNYTPEIDQNRQPTGRLQIQLIPALMGDFLAVAGDPILFTYHLKDITTIHCSEGWAAKLHAQYAATWRHQTGPVAPQQPAQPQATVRPAAGQRLELFPEG